VAAGLLLVGSIAAAVGHVAADDPAPAGGRGTEVVIDGFQFGPRALHVGVGATVTWENHDDYAHTVSGGDGIPERSPDITPGDTYQYTFSDSGTYDYVCTIHPNMHATVIVGQS
jgi:plastocyanin